MGLRGGSKFAVGALQGAQGGQNTQPTVVPQASAGIAAPAPTAIEQSDASSRNLRQTTSLANPTMTYRISGMTADDFLNMRQGPAVTYPVVQRLQGGVDGVTLIGEPVTNGTTRWQQISSRGVVGWVNADYLVPSQGGQNTPPTVVPAVSNVGPTSEGLPPGFVWETTPAPGATPTPVRRAIEQSNDRG
jgi:uncharacterized protein YraI